LNRVSKASRTRALFVSSWIGFIEFVLTIG
jgi:hypothetical protein